MTLPKKGLRNITVDGVKYAWSARGNDGRIGLFIVPKKYQHCLITAGFDYHSKVVKEYTLPEGGTVQSLKQQIVITGYIVRQVILHAINAGWTPTDDTPVLNLGAMDDKVDLRIPTNE